MLSLKIFWSIDFSIVTINCGQVYSVGGVNIATEKNNQIIDSSDIQLVTCCNAQDYTDASCKCFCKNGSLMELQGHFVSAYFYATARTTLKYYL